MGRLRREQEAEAAVEGFSLDSVSEQRERRKEAWAEGNAQVLRGFNPRN